MSNEGKLDIIRWLQKANELLINAVMLDSLMVAYLQFMIMLKEIKENAKSGTKVFV